MDSFKILSNPLRVICPSLETVFEVDRKRERISELESAAQAPDLWNDQKRAQSVLQEKSDLENICSAFDALNDRYEAAQSLFDIAKDDEQLLSELNQEIEAIGKDIERMKIEALFDGKFDANDCFIEINAGAGGTESNDWASMLMRMYNRWAELMHGFKVDIVDEVCGDTVGYKSCVLKLVGKNAYGWSRTECGVHRLVRISPFDANAKRHTSFASVWAYPIVDDCKDVEIDPGTLRIDTFRASGAGGQHVNKTDSAIRITHLPTGIVAQCQTDRSQHRNKAEAMSMLRAQLYEIERKKHAAEIDGSTADKAGISWGNQIRSYVLQPYQMIKDLRTKHEVGNVRKVLDGDLDDFIISSLLHERQ